MRLRLSGRAFAIYRRRRHGNVWLDRVQPHRKRGTDGIFFLLCSLKYFLGSLPETLYVGANANNGANAGFGNANTNNAPSNANANIGSRLGFWKFFLQANTLALAKK